MTRMGWIAIGALCLGCGSSSDDDPRPEGPYIVTQVEGSRQTDCNEDFFAWVLGPMNDTVDNEVIFTPVGTQSIQEELTPEVVISLAPQTAVDVYAGSVQLGVEIDGCSLLTIRSETLRIGADDTLSIDVALLIRSVARYDFCAWRGECSVTFSERATPL